MDDLQSIVFTPAAVLDLLSQIDELKDLNISLTQTLSNDIQIQIGESIYIISSEDATEVSVDDSVVEEVEELNESAYQDLDNMDVELSEEPIESGLLKELAKSLLLGGMIRLSKKLL